MFGEKESQRKMVSIQLLFVNIYWLNREITNYWHTYARAIFNDPDWPVKSHHTVRQTKRKTDTAYIKTYQEAQKKHRNRYQQDMEKPESGNMELRRKFDEVRRNINAYKRLFNDEGHAQSIPIFPIPEKKRRTSFNVRQPRSEAVCTGSLRVPRLLCRADERFE